MLDKMKQMMELKHQADRLKRELDAITVEVSDVPGIRINISGSQEFRSIEIAPDLLGQEKKSDLERQLLRSLNTAIKKAQQTAAQRMAETMRM